MKRTIESEVKFEGEDGTPITLRFSDTSVSIGGGGIGGVTMSLSDFEQIQSEYARYTKACAEMARDAA